MNDVRLKNFAQSEAEEIEVLSETGSEGADVSAAEDPVLGDQETVGTVLAEPVDEHLFYSTSFADYTVTEGLLLLIFVILLVEFFLNLLRRWF